jgi:hypothetical protein
VRARTAQEIATGVRAEFAQRRNELRDLVSHLDALIKGQVHMVRLDFNEVRQQRDELQELADRIGVQMRTRSWLYLGLLQEAENVGLDLGYASPSKGKPQGPGIDYLIAAVARHGHEIGPDRACSLIKQFNALPRIRAIFRGEGNMRVDVDVVHSPLWFWMWL